MSVYPGETENTSYAIPRRVVIRPDFAVYFTCAVLARLYLNVSGRRFSRFSFESASGQIVFGQMASLARAVFDTTTFSKADARQASTTTNSLCVKYTSIHTSLELFVCCLPHEFDLSILYVPLYVLGFEWARREWQGPTNFAFLAPTLLARSNALLFGCDVCLARRLVETTIFKSARWRRL